MQDVRCDICNKAPCICRDEDDMEEIGFRYGR